ncbi:MAG TPA: helix-turn-helix transcriptional regulator [Thermomicrobiales bacterium]|jgi:hypothetical protein|nr:helix-turn-helix transcriptional regulator [Thermomicrobiales bacterium]
MAYGEWSQVQAQRWTEFVWQSLHYAEMSTGCLAFAVGTPVDVVGRWLDGKQQPSIEDCLAVARALGVNRSRLLDLAGHPPLSDASSYRDFAA